MKLTFLTEDVPAAFIMLKRAYSPFTKYEGDINDIAKTIIQKCYSGTFFQVSLGHFPQFYMRDFGMCVRSLWQLGYKKECTQTVLYALQIYKANNRVSTTIDQHGKCVDFFAYGPDSLAFLLHSMRITNYKLTKSDKAFLKEQIKVCLDKVWDTNYGGIKRNTYFSSSKDHYKRNASCYDFCMVGWIIQSADKLKITHPLSKMNFEKQLIKLYWGKTGFYDDLDKEEYSGDAQTFPFYCGILSLSKHNFYFKKSVQMIQKLGLDSPFPIKYTASRNKRKELFFPSLAAPNYEGDSVWIHTGLCYMEVIAEFDTSLLKVYLDSYTQNLKTYQNFLEVYDKRGKPYRSLLYKCDESMLWISMYYQLVKSTKSLS